MMSSSFSISRTYRKNFRPKNLPKKSRQAIKLGPFSPKVPKNPKKVLSIRETEGTMLKEMASRTTSPRPEMSSTSWTRRLTGISSRRIARG